MKFSLSQKTCDYLQRLDFEIEGLKTQLNWICTHCNVERTDDWREEKFREMGRELRLMCMEKNMAFDEIRRRYVPLEFRTHEFEFSLDYDTCEGKIYAKVS